MKFPWIYDRLKSENPGKDESWIKNEYRRIARSSSYNNLLEKYGPEKTEEIRRKMSKGHTLEGQIEKYGKEEGTKRYNDFLRKKAVNLQNQINKYGEEEGRKRYKESVNNRRNTLENMIKRHGLEEGTKRYNQYVLRSKNTLDNFIRVYGEVEGEYRYRSYVRKAVSSTNCYSKISKELFDEIVRRLPDHDKSEFFYAENEISFPVKFPSGMTMEVKVDFYMSSTKKIIEFFGDYWHKNVNFVSDITDEVIKKFNWDLDRLSAIENSDKCSGIFQVWESEYKLDKEGTINKLINFLNN